MPSRGKYLPPTVIEALGQADLVLHAGDITEGWVLDELRRHARVVAVAGNNDGAELWAQLPRKAVVPAGRFRVGLVHGDGPGRSTFARAAAAFADARVDCVVFGHSHQPLCVREGDVLYLNPGSPTDRRREPRYSFAWLRAGESLTAEHVFFDRRT